MNFKSWLTKPAKPLSGPIKLGRQALSDYRGHWRQLVGIVVVVALPLAIIGLAVTDPVVGTYGSFIAVIMNLALIWGIMQVGDGKSAGTKAAYYRGTASLVGFMLICVVLAAQTLPLVIGAVIFNSATLATTVGASVGEKLLIGVLWLVLALPSFYWLTHYIFTVFSIQPADATPIQALRASRAATRGQGWQVFGRLAALVAMAIVLILVPTAAILIVLPLAVQNAGIAILQLVVSLTILPLTYLYLYKLYRELT